MQKFLRFLMLAVLFLPFALQAQNTLTVANGTTTNSNVPVYGLYVDDYVRCQTIYPASMIAASSQAYDMTGGSITNLTYYLSSPASDSWGAADFVVKIKEVTATTLSAFVDMTDATTVYTGSLDGTQSTMNITFSTPYTYQGGNLLIEIYNTVEGTYKNAYFYGVTESGASWQGYSSTGWDAVTGSAQNFIPKTTFTFTGGSQITCPPITTLNIDAAQTTSNSLTLTWTDAFNTGVTYTVYDMSDNSVIATSITDTFYTVTGLTANTLYTFGVETNCSATDASAIVTTSGRTGCGACALPFSETFNASLASDLCWRGASGVTADEAISGTPLNLTAINWTYSSLTNNGIDAGHYYVNIYGTSCKRWMITPEIDLSTASNPLLSFDAVFTRYSGTGAATGFENNTSQVFKILATTNNGQTWTNITDISLSSIANDSYIPQYVDLTAYAGETVRIAFYAQSTTSGGDNNLHVDNIQIQESTGDICYPVSGLSASNITAHEATLTWSSNVNDYTIYNMSDTSVVVTVSDTTYTLSGLASDTQYSFGVAANCTSGSSNIIAVNFHTQISCPVPTGLAAVLTPGDGTVASLSWTENGSATNWQICLNGDTNNLIDVTENPYNLTGLTAEQAYTAKVRAYCDVDDHSVWSSSITFTPTNSFFLTVNEGTSTNGYIPIYGYYCDNYSKSQFIIPAVNLAPIQSGTINKMVFYASQSSVNWGVAEFNVYVTETSETTLSALTDTTGMTQVYAGSLAISNNKMEVTFATPYTYMGGNLMISFLQTIEGDYVSTSWYGVSASGASVGGYNTSISQQNFLPKTTFYFTPGADPICLPVTNLTVSNVTSDGATLSWNGNADGYTILDLSDTTVVATISNATTYTLSGLDPMTQYTFGVVANCGSIESIIASISFNTACVAIEIPYTETFEPASTALSCWTTQGQGTWSIGTGDYSTTTGAYEGSYNAKITHNTTGYVTKLISPALDGAENGLVLDFAYVMRAWASDIDELRVYTRAGADSAWQQVGEYTNAVTTWTLESISIPNAVYQVAFEYTDSYGYGLGIDNVVFTALGDYCAPVTNITVDSTTTNSVFLSWTDDNNTGSYTIYNMADTSVVASNVATLNYEVTGLTAATNYTFGVVANCSADNASAPRTVAAATECGIVDVFPYVQDFTVTPACWTLIDADGDGFNWEVYAAAGAMQSASYDNTAEELEPDNWLISPQFAIPASGNYEVTWSATAQDQSWPAEHYGVFISTTTNTDTAAFTMIEEWTLSTGIFNPVIDLSNYSGQNIYIALRHFNCTNQFRISIDDFIVREQAGANQVTINVGQNNPAYGSVTGAGIYNIGDNVTVTATPASGYTFSKWVDENLTLISTDNPYTFVAATNLTLNAIFLNSTGTTYTITVQVNDSTMGTATGGGTYTAGDQITLSATAFTGYQFVNWTQESGFGINVVGTEPDLIITVTGDKTFIANFEADTTTPPVTQYTVTLSSANSAMGTVSPEGTTTVNAGEQFTATATAAADHHFVAWVTATGTQVSTDNPYIFTVTENVTLYARFEANDPGVEYFNVTVTSANTSMGNVSSTASGSVAQNTEVTVTATALEGYRFVNWTDATGTVVSTDNPYTFTVTADIALTANFEIIDGINDIDASNILIYAHNSTITVRGAEGNDIYVYDMNGRCIYQHANANETETINMSSTGIYMVRVSNVLFKKVVIMK